MDLFLAGLKQLNVVVATVLVVYAWTVLIKDRSKLLFLAMMLSFTVSTVLFFPEGEINEWVKHAPFYLGQLLLFLFVHSLGDSKKEKKPALIKSAAVKPVAVAIGLGATEAQVITSGTEHILAAPLFLLLGFSLLLKLVFTKHKQTKIMVLYFLLASMALTMIHVVEFFVESKGFIQFLHGEPVEVVELLWFYLACALFALGLRKYRSVAPGI